MTSNSTIHSQTKICTKCKQEKAIDSFFKQHNGKYGVGSFCRICKSADQARFNRENPDHKKQQRHKIYLKRKTKANVESSAYNAKHREKLSQLRKERHLANKEMANKQSRQYYETHRERLRALQKKHYRENKEAYAPRRHRRRARIARSPGNHTADQIIQLKDHQSHKCAICRVSILNCFHIDHIIPLVRGGDNTIRNIQLLCPPCNMSKGAKDPLDYMRSRGFLL